MPESGQDFQVLFEGAPDLLYTQDLAGRITRVNRAFERVTGSSRLEVVGSDVHALLAPEYREFFKQRILELVGGAASHPFEIEFQTSRGRIPLELSIELIFDNGIPAGLQCFGRDITDKLRERMERSAADSALLVQTEQLATFSRYLQLLHRLSTTGYSSLDDLYADYLSTGCQIFGLECGAITQVTARGLKTRKTCGTPIHLVETNVEEVLAAKETVVGSASALKGGSFYVGTPLVVNGETFGVLAFWARNGGQTHPRAKEIIEMMARGIESAIHQRWLTEELEHTAKHDSLTGLANRLLMTEQFESAIEEARRKGHSVGVLFIDLDNFKQINDSMGHASGDVVLQQIAQRFLAAADSHCALARMGGDEFTAVIGGIRDCTEAIEIANHLLGTLADPILVDGVEVHVNASAGVSLFPLDGTDGDTLLRKADAAMYLAKQLGNNIVQCSGAGASDSPPPH
jgi:diguanylate cyclase (GGDEF)-like protein/PAS domain S-box-containing protein